MDLNTINALIADKSEQVRELQKKYFSNRTNQNLEASKRAERELDGLIVQRKSIKGLEIAPELFS